MKTSINGKETETTNADIRPGNVKPPTRYLARVRHTVIGPVTQTFINPGPNRAQRRAAKRR